MTGLQCGNGGVASSEDEKGTAMMFMKFHSEDGRKPLLIAIFTVLLATGGALLLLV